MALTAQQIVDTRRWMGYSVAGDSAYFSFREQAYSDVSYMGINLDDPVGGRLAHLSAEQESTLIAVFLTPLAAREAEIQAAASNLDTDIAAVWTRNKSEVSDRKALFNALRLEMCGYLGFPPGPAIRAQGRLVRS